MIVSVPHVRFMVDDRGVWVDAHFPPYVENRIRIAALVRLSVDPEPDGIILKLEMTAKELHRMFVELLKEARGELERLGVTRGSKMGRWTLSRSLFMITGHFRKISEDEKTATLERELRNAVGILEKLVKAEPCEDIRYLNVEIKNSVVQDRTYRKLAEIDEGFRRRLLEVIQ